MGASQSQSSSPDGMKRGANAVGSPLVRRCSSGLDTPKGGCVCLHTSSGGRKGGRASAFAKGGHGASSDGSSGGVFSPSRTHPTVALLISDLKEDGVLDDLDNQARQVSQQQQRQLEKKKASLLASFQPATPARPVKLQSGRSILRRHSSIGTDPKLGIPTSVVPVILSVQALAAAATARQTARRLTWNDAKENAGLLEHIQLYDTKDALSSCSHIAPTAHVSASAALTVTRRKSTGSTAFSGSISSGVAPLHELASPPTLNQLSAKNS